MLNKILIKMIIKQLLKDTFSLTLIEPTFEIKKEGKHYYIKIIATLIKNTTVSIKHMNLRVDNWVALIIGYESKKKLLEHILIDNLNEED